MSMSQTTRDTARMTPSSRFRTKLKPDPLEIGVVDQPHTARHGCELDPSDLENPTVGDRHRNGYLGKLAAGAVLARRISTAAEILHENPECPGGPLRPVGHHIAFLEGTESAAVIEQVHPADRALDVSHCRVTAATHLAARLHDVEIQVDRRLPPQRDPQDVACRGEAGLECLETLIPKPDRHV